jgi:hypothetical protein
MGMTGKLERDWGAGGGRGDDFGGLEYRRLETVVRTPVTIGLEMTPVI